MDPLVAHQRAQDAFAGVLAKVSPDQRGAPTPCSEWTINDLIEHVIGRNEYVGQRAGRDTEALFHQLVAHSAVEHEAVRIDPEGDGTARGIDSIDRAGKLRNRVLGRLVSLASVFKFGDNFPGSALITITALAAPDAKIEIQGYAVVGDK